MEITIDNVYELFDPDFENGFIYWKELPLKFFSECEIAGRGRKSAEGNRNMFNSKFAGKKAFNGSSGIEGKYKKGRFRGKHYHVHRIIFAMFYGRWPTMHIDHIDGNPSNNSIKNLREVTPLENARNRRKSKANTTGENGIYFDKYKKKYMVSLGSNLKHVFGGSFKDIEDAIKKRDELYLEIGFHENHAKRQ